MARPYSNDLRERAAAAVSSGRRCREVAVLFDVSVASVAKWSQRRRATGSAAAKPMGGHRKRLLEPHRALVIERLKAVPDLTLKALVAELAERGIATCPGVGLAAGALGGAELQEKACSPRSRRGRRSPGGARNGRSTRDGLTPSASSSSAMSHMPMIRGIMGLANGAKHVLSGRPAGQPKGPI